MSNERKDPRKELGSFGRKRKADYVRWVRDVKNKRSGIFVLWNEGGRRAESFDDTRKGLAEAKAYAEGVHERLQMRRPLEMPPITLRALYEAHVTAKASEWSYNTLRLSNWRWGKLELFARPLMPAQSITRETLDKLKVALLENQSPNQVRLAIKAITSVFRWGVDRDLIPPTKVTNYRAGFSKAVLRTGPKMAEFSETERTSILSQLDPRDARQWRAWVLTVLLGYCGPRVTATRELTIDDIRLDLPKMVKGEIVFGGAIHWREETDKMSHDRWQPMPTPVAEALWIAVGWRQATGYEGSYVFFRPAKGMRDLANGGYVTARTRKRAHAAEDKPYAYSSYLDQLSKACKRANVKRALYQGAHAFRRGAAGHVHAKTGSEKMAADWIGDKSIKVVRDHYLLTREEELRKTASLMAPESSAPSGTATSGRAGLPEGPEPECDETRQGATSGALKETNS